ncbi:conjugal transfer protein TrbF [Hoeflea poritis]|uniref:Conjugal transfer protein TrbF n=1 Tax=Hoeflea poritis TaxID=2993659 RepID=A0ABT4VX54_9HYPH|nr:conjugal transfer protein TrbF [Hoeflea poritis]MDA4848790.1 conjugal transfer protein TrbF [Hoeflea poritis]
MFKRSTTTYGQTPQPETPYQKAAQVWDMRMGDALVRAKNWRLMAFGCLTLSLLLSSGVIWQAGRSTITPYVVEVDRLGDVRTVGPATEAYEPTDAQIAYHLARFIENVRSLPIDPVIVRKNWLRAYDYTTTRGANGLNDHARVHDPFSKVGKRTIAVDVTSVVRSSDDSFDVRWREQTFENGSLADTAHYTAVLSIAIQRPRTEEALRKNPLGIYVHSLNWSKDLIAGEPK